MTEFLDQKFYAIENILEKFTQLEHFLHDHRSLQSRQISSLVTQWDEMGWRRSSVSQNTNLIKS